MIKNAHKIILLIVIIVSIGTYLYSVFHKEPPPASTCSALETKVKTRIEEANHCRTDSDCAIMELGVCPFGCYGLINKSEDTDVITETITRYTSQCLSCTYTCAVPSEVGVLRCHDNKCGLYP